MVRRSGIEGAPRDYVAEGEWPDARLRPDAPGELAIVQHIARALRDALEQENVAALARRVGVHRSVLYAVMAGDRVPDLITVARLDLALPDTKFWPDSTRL